MKKLLLFLFVIIGLAVQGQVTQGYALRVATKTTKFVTSIAAGNQIAITDSAKRIYKLTHSVTGAQTMNDVFTNGWYEVVGDGDNDRTVTITGIVTDTAFVLYFTANRPYYYIVLQNVTANTVDVSLGTTPGGTELLNAETVAANSYKAVLVMLTPSTVTPLYITSTNWNSSSINISTISKAI